MRKVTLYILWNRTMKGGWTKVQESTVKTDFGVNLNKVFRGKKLWKITTREITLR